MNYWIGQFKSDSNFFKDSLAISSIATEYLYEEIAKFVRTYNEGGFFYFEDSSILYHARERGILGENNTNALNKKELIFELNNKIETKTWLMNYCKTPNFISLHGSECIYNNIKSFFPKSSIYIIQEPISSGGDGTFILTKENQNTIYSKISKNKLYIVSEYITDSKSYNITILIDDYSVYPLKGSMQLSYLNNNQPLYCGTDFDSYNNLDPNLVNNMEIISYRISNLLKTCSYRGVLGIDFLLSNKNIFILEINPRFQGSSDLLNNFIEKNLGISLYQLNDMCFNHQNISTYIEKLKDKPISGYSIKFWEKSNFSSDLIKDIGIINPTYPFIYKSEKAISENVKKKFLTNNLKECNNQINNFYNYFSSIYHKILPDWECDIQNEAKVLLSIIRQYSNFDIKNILDCTCGIGVQSLSFAKLGYNVLGADISEEEINFAINEANKRKLTIDFKVLDVREISSKINKKFDLIISIDNALPHLLTKKDMLLAFKNIYDLLPNNGIFLSSYRNYDDLLKEKPQMAYPLRIKHDSNEKIISFKLWEWDGAYCKSKQYVILDDGHAERLMSNTYTQWAITKNELLEISKQVGFSKIIWLDISQTNYYEPLLLVIK